MLTSKCAAIHSIKLNNFYLSNHEGIISNEFYLILSVILKDKNYLFVTYQKLSKRNSILPKDSLEKLKVSKGVNQWVILRAFSSIFKPFF